MNLSTRRIWCYECKGEVFLEAKNNYESDQDEVGNPSLNRDSGHGSYTTLRANSPERGKKSLYLLFILLIINCFICNKLNQNDKAKCVISI